jgi:hypothetical protein
MCFKALFASKNEGLIFIYRLAGGKKMGINQIRKEYVLKWYKTRKGITLDD